MANKIRVLVKEPGKEPEVREIEHTLEGMRAVVEGYIECPPSELNGLGVDLWANEEGKLNGLAPNITLFGGRDVVVGTVFLAANDGEGATIGLSDEQVEAARAWLAERTL